MARKVAEFEATGKITPTDRGFSAMEQAGRRVGPFFTQMAAGAREVARLTQQIDDEFGKGVRDVADEQGRAMTSFLRFSGLEQQDAQRIQEAVIRANDQRGGGGGGAGVRVRGFESDPFGMFGKNWGNASEFGNGGPLLSHLARQHMQRTNPLPGPKNDIEGGGVGVLRGGATNQIGGGETATDVQNREASKLTGTPAGTTIIRGDKTTDTTPGATILAGNRPAPGSAAERALFPNVKEVDWQNLNDPKKFSAAEREYALYGPKDATGLPHGVPPEMVREGSKSFNQVSAAPLAGPITTKHLFGALSDTQEMPPDLPKNVNANYPPYLGPPSSASWSNVPGFTTDLTSGYQGWSYPGGTDMSAMPTVAPSAAVPFQPAWGSSAPTPTDGSSVSISDPSAPSVWSGITGSL